MRLIYLSPLPWCSFTQRPHEFVLYFHKVTEGKVLWVDPYPARLPKLSDINRLKGNMGLFIRPEPAWLTVLKPRALPFEPLPLISNINKIFFRPVVKRAKEFAKSDKTAIAFGKPSAMAVELLDIIDATWSLYDAMDDFPAFHTGLAHRSMEYHENILARRVSQLIVSSSNLVQKFANQSLSSTLIRNAFSRNLPMPGIRKKTHTRPRIGYVGTLSGWFDWELLTCLANDNPGCDFILIGPLLESSVQDLPANVFIKPPLEHNSAMIAMSEFDAGIIPFKKNKLTESVDPIKYYEYRALGLPVISSAFGEMKLHKEEGVFLVDDYSDSRAAISNALNLKSNEESIMSFRDNNSWDKRFEAAGLFKGLDSISD